MAMSQLKIDAGHLVSLVRDIWRLKLSEDRRPLRITKKVSGDTFARGRI